MSKSNTELGSAGYADLTLHQLVQRARLEALDIVKYEVNRVHDARPGGLQKAEGLKWNLDASASVPAQPQAVGAAILCGLTLVAEEAGVAVAFVNVDLRLAYAFADLNAPPSEEMLRRFADQVALHHAWPFLRERVRDATVLCGLPPFILPLRLLP